MAGTFKSLADVVHALGSNLNDVINHASNALDNLAAAAKAANDLRYEGDVLPGIDGYVEAIEALRVLVKRVEIGADELHEQFRADTAPAPTREDLL